MMRSLVSLRPAVESDAEVLAEIWSEALRRCEPTDLVEDMRTVIARIAAGTGEHGTERIVVAEYDGQVAGAVHLLATTLSPINLEPVARAISPHVLPQFRRHGVGRALMEAAVAFAEEHGIALLASAAAAGSRDANRFMARLSLGPHVVLRLAPTGAVKARLTAQRPAMGRTHGSRQLTQVLAARRSLRRSEPTPG